MDLSLDDYEKLQFQAKINHGGAEMRFSTPNNFTFWRVQSIYEKEPWTLEWIASIAPGEILLDCGANVGMYTVWAAVTRSARVYAFEPESQNYAILNQNILLNDISGLVTAYCMALSDTTGLSTLHMADLRAGASCHAVGEALDFRLQPMEPVFAQGCVASTLDDLVRGGAMPVPHHMKIDVDGLEPRVIAGARETLANPVLRSLLIETNQNLATHMAMVAELHAAGFRHDEAQVARAERKDGAFLGVAEYVFRR